MKQLLTHSNLKWISDIATGQLVTIVAEAITASFGHLVLALTVQHNTRYLPLDYANSNDSTYWDDRKRYLRGIDLPAVGTNTCDGGLYLSFGRVTVDSE